MSAEPNSAAAEFLRGFRTVTPIMIGMIPIGLIMGATCAFVGLSPLAAGLMGGFNFAGGSEFAALSLWAAVPPAAAIVLTTWLVNSRHIVMSAALTPWLEKQPRAVAFAAFFFMCDECWSLSMRDCYERKKAGLSAAEAFSPAFYLGVGGTLWFCWWTSAAVGCTLGGMIGDLRSWGFQAAFPALFITLSAMMWPGRRRGMPVVVSGLAAALSSLVVSTPLAVMLGIIAGLAAAWIFIRGGLK
ncbi:AzlC family ABC transporter permease [Mesosutterella sp. OilRF-GAM-744-9]|uniref:AzlC family ABC transporter permease n=1 Tax=Mesosutterella porci TaxID=2915351 RepID=A0ABS9MNA6_9BURK|nr:AzlC family ABC transporter permease [Mesosutterella sp. oilRF-744-WT-GAM-9]MCG5030103.1 AzlC family ABC transporter permease [Mesosutterella sp. oilRF-744-WT-GAM-9]